MHSDSSFHPKPAIFVIAVTALVVAGCGLHPRQWRITRFSPDCSAPAFQPSHHSGMSDIIRKPSLPNQFGSEPQELISEMEGPVVDSAQKPEIGPMVPMVPDYSSHPLPSSPTTTSPEVQAEPLLSTEKVPLPELGSPAPLPTPSPMPKRKQWPAIMSWNRGFGPERIDSDVKLEDETASLKPWGKAGLSADGDMQLASGAYVVQGLDDQLLRSAKKSNQLTIEVVLSAKNLRQQGPARIVTFSSDHNSRNFTLGQDANRLIFRLRTSNNDLNGTDPELTIGQLREQQWMHVIVSYRDGLTICTVNGEKVFETDELKGDFSNWEPHHLLFGDEWNRQRDWSGELQRVNIFTRFVGEKAAHRMFMEWQTSQAATE